MSPQSKRLAHLSPFRESDRRGLCRHLEYTDKSLYFRDLIPDTMEVALKNALPMTVDSGEVILESCNSGNNSGF